MSRMIKRSVGLTGVMFILGAIACASAGVSSRSGTTTAPAQDQDQDMVTGSQVRSIMSALADDSMEGRMTASQGSAKAAAFIAGQMRSIGLVPQGDSGYFQRVPIAITRRANGQERLTLAA